MSFRFLPLILSSFLVLAAFWQDSSAQIIVDGAADVIAEDGVCTLREAIEAINTGQTVNECLNDGSADTIEIQAGPIVLNTALPTLTAAVTINGNGFTVSGNHSVRVFNIGSGGDVSIHELRVTLGNAAGTGRGGGIRVGSGGKLVLERSVVTSSTAWAGGGIYSIGAANEVQIIDSLIRNNRATNEGGEGGGGLNNDGGGTMTIIRSTIADNIGRFAGGIANYNSSHLLILNSTVSGNSCFDDNAAGGVENFIGGSNNGSLLIRNSTITDNTCIGNGSGGGLFNNTVAPVLVNTIVAGNIGTRPDLSGNFSSAGHNLIGDGSGSTGFIHAENGDQVGDDSNPIDPLLDPLSDNGGRTPTHALLAGSPAIDSGDNDDAPSTDQRGPGFPRIVQNTIDIGAFELCDPLPQVTSEILAGSGSVSPATTTVVCGETLSIELRPDAGYAVENIGGTCPGSIDGNRFNSEPITADCTLEVSFEFLGDEIFADRFMLQLAD